MRGLDEIIRKHCTNAEELRKIYLGQKLNYEKTCELRESQNKEYNKMLFFQKLKREMQK